MMSIKWSVVAAFFLAGTIHGVPLVEEANGLSEIVHNALQKDFVDQEIPDWEIVKVEINFNPGPNDFDAGYDQHNAPANTSPYTYQPGVVPNGTYELTSRSFEPHLGPNGPAMVQYGSGPMLNDSSLYEDGPGEHEPNQGLHVTDPIAFNNGQGASGIVDLRQEKAVNIGQNVGATDQTTFVPWQDQSRHQEAMDQNDFTKDPAENTKLCSGFYLIEDEYNL